jgi:hypothetical protein
MLLLREPLARRLLYGSGKFGGIVYITVRGLFDASGNYYVLHLAITPQYNIFRSTDQ